MQNIINPNLQKKFGMPISCFLSLGTKELGS